MEEIKNIFNRYKIGTNWKTEFPSFLYNISRLYDINKYSNNGDIYLEIAVDYETICLYPIYMDELYCVYIHKDTCNCIAADRYFYNCGRYELFKPDFDISYKEFNEMLRLI